MFTAQELDRIYAAATAKNMTSDEVIRLINCSNVNALPTVKRENEILRLISQDEKITVKACDGKATLAKAKEVFPSGIDSDFKNWSLDNSSVATTETVAEVYELIESATFTTMFSSFGVELENLCFTQAQIKEFCVSNTKWLRTDGYATLFLFRKDEKKAATPDNFFVARVGLRSDGLRVRVGLFVYDGVWGAEYRSRVVLPQLTFESL